MTPLLFLALSVAGGVGAAARFVLDGAIGSFVARRNASAPRARAQGGRLTVPVGTFVINATGSLALGLVVGLTAAQLLPEPAHAIIGAGFLGGYTTFSTASVDTVRLLQQRRPGAAALNGVGMLVVTVALATTGLLLGSAL